MDHQVVHGELCSSVPTNVK